MAGDNQFQGEPPEFAKWLLWLFSKDPWREHFFIALIASLIAVSTACTVGYGIYMAVTPPARLSPLEFEQQLAKYRAAQVGTLHELFQPQQRKTNIRHKNQLAIVQASLNNTDIHTRSSDTTDAILRLVNNGSFPTTVGGLSEHIGPNGTTIDDWIQSLEVMDITITLNGNEYINNIRWWLIYVGVRDSLENGYISSAMDLVRSMDPTGQIAANLYITLFKNERIGNAISTRVQSSYDARIIKTDDMLKSAYKRWYANPSKYSHSDLAAEFTKLIRDSLHDSPAQESTDEGQINELRNLLQSGN